MAITLPNSAQSAGVPSQWSDTISAAANALITGSEPTVLTQDLIVAASQTMLELTPVGFDGNGRLVPALLGTTPAIGILVIGVTTDASTTYKGAAVYRGGCFNPDLINWPASYDTDAKKFAAFNGAPSPTNIIVRRPKLHTI